MGTYTDPGVHIEKQQSGSRTVPLASASTSAMVGATRSGVVGEPQLVTSWLEFMSTFARGLDTPFFVDGFLPYSAYLFFANGGQELYVSRIASESAKKATKTGTNLKVTASSEGEWGNTLTVEIMKNEDYSDTEGEENLEFDVLITIGSTSVTVGGVYLDTIETAINSSKTAKTLIGDVELQSVEQLTEEIITLEGGMDGVQDLSTNDYLSGLDSLSSIVEDITMVSIPGGTTTTLINILISFCNENNLFPVINAPIGYDIEDVRTFRKSIRGADYGALVYPWGNMTDPLTQVEKTVPSDGAFMGVTARTILERGEHKAPAGIDAYVNGFNSMEVSVSQKNLKILNPAGVISIMPRRNYGLVVWGARGLNSSDEKMMYTSDHLLNITTYKNLYALTQFAVFEPNGNNSGLWKDVYNACKNYLEKLRKAGALVGDGEGSAWYVTVDETNNTQETIDQGYLNIEVGYAPVKPAEFVVIKLAHSIMS